MRERRDYRVQELAEQRVQKNRVISDERGLRLDCKKKNVTTTSSLIGP